MAPVRLHFTRDLSAPSWALRHTEGEVPDRWPYGLHHLLDHGIPLTPFTPRAQALVKVGRRLGGGYDWDRLFAGGQAALCWDERTGVPVALSGVPTLTGLIWLTEPRRRRPSDALARRALARATVFVLSEKQLAPVTSAWSVPASRVHYVPFGIDPTFWHPREGDRTGVLVVGNDRHRDHQTAIRAVQGAGAPLTLITRQRVDVPHTTHLDHRGLRDAYANHGVVAVATTPNMHASGVTVLLEAMACGRPVVATRGGGLELYLTRDTGVLVDPGDHRAMATAIRALLADPGRAHEMGAAARASVVSRFSTARMAADLAHLVERIM